MSDLINNTDNEPEEIIVFVPAGPSAYDGSKVNWMLVDERGVLGLPYAPEDEVARVGILSRCR